MVTWLMFACSGIQEEVEESPLIDLSSWVMMDLRSDILSSHQPEEVICDISAFVLEIDQLEIRTDSCNYVALQFEVLRDIQAGTPLEILVLHTGLWALEEAEAHFAFYVDDELLWEETRPVPSDTEFFFYEQPLERSISKGAYIYFHLHNHGANDWKLGYFRQAD